MRLSVDHCIHRDSLYVLLGRALMRYVHCLGAGNCRSNIMAATVLEQDCRVRTCQTHFLIRSLQANSTLLIAVLIKGGMRIWARLLCDILE